MSKYFLIILLLTFFSCSQKQAPTLEINFTSRNPDTINELKSFYLTSLIEINKTFPFTNIKNVSPNKFVFEHLENGTYIGLLGIEKNGMTYNISIDSIVIKSGANVISKEVNLGTVRL